MTTKTLKKGNITKTFRIDDNSNKAVATIKIDGNWISNPSLQSLYNDGWEDYTPPTPPPYVPSREELIHSAIRERYTENDEFQVTRQYLANPDNPAYKTAFDEYNAYVEYLLARYPEEN